MRDTDNPNGYPTRDWSTKAGADALAEKIADYWAARGRKVETMTFDFGPKFHAVRSDLTVASGVWRKPE